MITGNEKISSPAIVRPLEREADHEVRSRTRSSHPRGRARRRAGGGRAPPGAAPQDSRARGVHIALAAGWLVPAETEGIITPFMVLYALHDALVKPMPAGPSTPSLAESFTQSKDGLTYEFVIRK